MATRFWLIALVILVVGALGFGAWYYLGVFQGSGNLQMEVHDSPCTDCAHVWVTFSSVSVHESDMSGSGWTSLAVNGSAVDLMALNGSAFAKTIGLDTLKAGHYEQVRINVTHVVVGLTDGTNVTAKVPASNSADANGAFDIHSGATTTISIDIDLASSVHVVTEGTGVSVMFTPNIGSVVVV